MTPLRELWERRDWECRLTPDRALETVDEAEEFLLDRGLFTRTPDGALPSLFEACHESPYAPDRPGFGQWPKTKWWWGMELERRGLLGPKIHRGKTLVLSPAVARLVDPICRAELKRLEASDDPELHRLLNHLAQGGPAQAQDICIDLRLRSKDLKSMRSPLERVGAVVSRWMKVDDDQEINILARWDQAHPSFGNGEPDFGALLVAAVRAAVVAPEPELPKWFSWSWRFEHDLVDRLVAEGRLTRPEEGWLALPD